MLTDYLQTSGLRRAALTLDLAATTQRIHLHGDLSELESLDHDQLVLYLAATDAKPGDDLWRHVEGLVGHELKL